MLSRTDHKDETQQQHRLLMLGGPGTKVSTVINEADLEETIAIHSKPPTCSRVAFHLPFPPPRHSLATTTLTVRIKVASPFTSCTSFLFSRPSDQEHDDPILSKLPIVVSMKKPFETAAIEDKGCWSPVGLQGQRQQMQPCVSLIKHALRPSKRCQQAF